ncbi:MAG: aminotransferase class I/II-fold pyridoxal phosphate-dependent enzyme [bacterium]|nr:aminotransferase class I/II-fold pyridoxal phosphate-dependent enzyme [bacterium]
MLTADNSYFEKYYADVILPNKGALRIIESSQGAYLTIEGKKYLNLCSNNYLGFAADKRVKEAAIEAIRKYGVGTTSVRSLVGTNVLHVELEKRLASFKNAEDALVLTGGYMTNLAVVQTLLGKEDVIISDELNHASIIDAVKLSQVQNKFIHKHNDIQNLRSFIPDILALQRTKKSDGQERRVLIVTDGVFSMDGDLAKLPELVEVATELNAFLMVDDAHGEGVLGSHGRGIVDHFGLHDKVDIEIGTLSKAFGVMGGFVTGRRELIAYIRSKARQYLFSNALSLPDTAALIESVKILEESDDCVNHLWRIALSLQSGLKELGFDLGHTQTPITPIMIGDEEKAKSFAKDLFLKGILVSPIVFPMVEKSKARLRLMPSVLHSQKDISTAVEVIGEVGKKYK